MAMSKKAQNVTTIAVAGVAVVFAILALLVHFKVIGPEAASRTTTTRLDGSTIVQMSSINEDGEVVYYTAISRYTTGDATALHWYPTTTKETSSSTTTKPETSEVSEVINVTDADGNQVTDADGNPVTEVTKYTVTVTTTKKSSTTKSSTVQVTDADGNPVTDADGNPVTKVVTTAATSGTAGTSGADGSTQASSESETTTTATTTTTTTRKKLGLR